MKAINLIFLSAFFSTNCAQEIPGGINLEFELGDLGSVKLSLKKRSSLNDNSIAVITTSQEHWHPDQNETIGNYEDREAAATFSVTFVEEGESILRKYVGSFLFKDKTYSMKAADENVINNVLASYKIKVDGVRYVVSETKDDIKLESNAKEREMRLENSEAGVVKREKRQVGQVQELIVEVFLVIDFSIYQRWFDFNKNDKNKAISSMMAYYSHIMTGIDTKYRSISSDKYTFSVRMCGIYFAEARMDSFTEVMSIRTGKRLSYTGALIELAKWVKNKGNIIPKHDLVASFTKYSSYGVENGLAGVRATCDARSTSITQDMGIYGTIDIAAHEIGHNLGADHDSQGNNCPAEEMYVMSPVNKHTENSHLHTFSACSIVYFEKHISSLKGDENCLLSKYTNKVVDTSIHTKQKMGLIYTMDQQCRHIVDPKSYFCSKGIESDETVCKRANCYYPDNGRCLTGANDRAYEGTPCGKNKWCVNKECVYDPEAPGTKDKCFNGDYIGTISLNGIPTGCKDLRTQKGLCDDPEWASWCCKTCPSLKSSNPNCPWGDIYKSCANTWAWNCAEPKWNKNCCDTCNKLVRMNPADCPYGDYWSNCAVHIKSCTDANTKKNCCRSCRNY